MSVLDAKAPLVFSIAACSLGIGLWWRSRDDARRRIKGCRGRRVLLVGAGPGAADLISVRGVRALRLAHFVVHDRLVSPSLLDEATRPGVVLLNVGKAPAKDRFPQSEINKLLVQLATNSHPTFEVPENAVIVRLKGGDPFVFGLGGDEVIALEEVGAQCEIVPGISSATAVPGFVGIPVSQKVVATSFTVVSGHIPPGQPGAADWDHMPRQNATLVVLMGVKSLSKICAHLLSQGWPPSTPSAIVESGTTNDERFFKETLNRIADVAAENKVKSPAVIVFGEVCSVIDSKAVLAKSIFAEENNRQVWGAARSL